MGVEERGRGGDRKGEVGRGREVVIVVVVGGRERDEEMEKDKIQE